MRGQGPLPGAVLSHRYSGPWCLSRGCEAPRLEYLVEYWLYGYPRYRILYGVNHFLPRHAYPLQDSSWHLDEHPRSSYYARWGWDRFITWVDAVRCAWAPIATSHCTRRIGHHFSKPQGRQCLSVTGSLCVCLIGGPSPALGWGGRRDSQTGGEILPAHAYHRVEKWKHGLLCGLVLFMLVAPPIYPGVVGPYLGMGCMVP
jgi:hypothetical protein